MGLLPWQSRFVYGLSDTVLDLELPSRPWAYRTSMVGGARDSASGVPAGYVVRRDHLLHVVVRIYETEWPAFEALLNWTQEGAESVTWYPDAEVLGTSYEVYIRSPRAGDEVTPEREEFPQVMDVTLVLRKVSGGAWALEYFVDA